VQIELARAEAGLGNLDEAEGQIRALLDIYGPHGNPLTTGALHEVLAELAALRGDAAAFADSVEEVGRLFRETRDPALVARHEKLARLAEAAPSLATGAPTARRSSRPPRMMTVLHRLRHGGDHTRSGSANWALKQVTELTGSTDGYLFLDDGHDVSCVAKLGEADDEAALTDWVRARLASLRMGSEQETCTTDDPGDLTSMDVGSKSYRLTFLAPRDENGGEVLGAFAIAGGGAVPFPVIATIADRLSGATVGSETS
jgi:hypothetical protein